jgi:uncharacterized protein YkwD
VDKDGAAATHGERRTGRLWRAAIALLLGGLLLGLAAPAIGVYGEEPRLGGLETAMAAVSAAESAAAAETEQPGELEAYALGLVNQARRQAGLAPLAWDPRAAIAARAHAQELVSAGYLSHFDRQGRSPLLRYAQAGGTAFLMENLAYGTGYPPGPQGLRQFLQDSLHTILAQRPPHDAHRQNLLDPAHTAVGIGLAQAAGRLALAQEFINQYVRVEGPALRRAQPGQVVVLAGQAVPGYRVYAVQVSWEPLPLAQPVVGAALPAAESYRLPAPEQTLAVVPAAERFQLAVPLEQPGRPGLYTLLLWALDPSGKPLPAAFVTVQVDETSR